MNPPDEVFLKRAAECERMANSLATLRAGLPGNEWLRDGRGVREWLRILARRLRTTSPIDTGSPPPVGHATRRSPSPTSAEPASCATHT
jgi:hypothetical protein